jgi:hypothetical protein
MPISLKHINYTDSDNIKLGKVNYNFDQLVANGGGPRGPQGSIGQDGPQGTTGQMGFQGPIGDEGTQGPSGPVTDNYWHKIVPDSYIDADRLVPICAQGDQFAPVVNIGYIESNPQYGTKLPLIGGKTPYQWNIHRRQYSVSNLRFENNSIPGGFDFKLEKSIAGKDQMTFGFENENYPNSSSTYRAAVTTFRGSASNDRLIITDNVASFLTATVFNSPVVIKRRLIIGNAGASINKIAISEDNYGLVKFKSVQELGGTVPFGTIVSILPSIFEDNTKFINSEQVTPDNDSPVEISVGKGIGNYEGWYLCNGKQWTDGLMTGTTLASYNVPKLGNFHYSIENNPFSANPTSQGTAPATPITLRTHITGGSNINMTATSVPTLVYNITSTVDTAEVLMFPGSGTTFKIKQLPQIIYLERGDLYWQDPGGGQVPSVPLTIVLDDTNPDLDPAKRLNPDPYTIATITDKPAGASYSLANLTVDAPAGYYWSTIPTPTDITGPGYVTVQSVTAVAGTYPTQIKLGINVNPHPAASPNPSPVTLSINTANFIGLATVPITLIRRDNKFGTSPTQYYTCSTPGTTTIQYNFNTGYYDYQLVFTAQPGWIFNTQQFIGLFGATVYDNAIFGFAPEAGAGHIEVKNNLTDYSVSNNNTTLTVNLRLDRIPLTGYLTTQGYALQFAVTPTAPKISERSQAFNEITQANGTGVFTNNLTIQNQTGATVYLWLGVYQGSGGTNANINASVTFSYVDWLGFPNTQTLTMNPAVPGTPVNTQYYAPGSYALPGGSVTSVFKRFSTSDGNHAVKLFWSTSSSPTAPKTQLIYSP